MLVSNQFLWHNHIVIKIKPVSLKEAEYFVGEFEHHVVNQGIVAVTKNVIDRIVESITADDESFIGHGDVLVEVILRNSFVLSHA